jgi:tripartite-type tricarboxylate transporter receptor subunit TctC
MRLLSLGLVGLALVFAPAQRAHAQDWPDRTVTFVVPFPAGAAVDALGRAVAQAASEKFGKQFIVDNRTGAGGNIGGASVAKSAPDGYTLLFGTPSPIAMNKLMYKSLTYDSQKDFIPVALVARSPLIIAAKADLPAKTLAELITFAKQNPGKINGGHPGNGTLGHITLELLQQFAGVEMTRVPYRGSAPLTTDLVSGQIDLATDFMPTYVPHVQAGKIKALAVTTRQRAKELPDVPTAEEAGFKGFEASAWYAIVAPTGTPREIVVKLNELVNAFLKSERGKTVLEHNALQAVGGPPEDLKAFIDAELAKWGPVIKAANIQM